MLQSYFYLLTSYFLVAVVLSFTLTPLMRLLSFRIGALDRGSGRRVHEGIVPRLGGGGIYLAIVLPAVVAILRGPGGEMYWQVTGILAAASLVFAVGVIDDVRGAMIRNKLAVEVAAGLVIYLWGVRIDVVSNPFGMSLELGWLSLPATVLWIVVITNAFNLIDGLDGLSAGTGILICGMLLYLAGGRSLILSVLLVVIIGSLLGFLRHNFPPATIFMGDSGSLLVGFLLGSVTILSSHKATAMATLMLPIIAFAHPLMDMVYAVLRRYHRGQDLGTPDREHIHHKLLEMGLSRRTVLLALYFMNFVILAGAIAVIEWGAKPQIMLAFMLSALVVLGLRLFGYLEFRAFGREYLRVLGLNRRRRYYYYLLKNFRHQAAASGSLETLKGHIEELLKKYHFDFAEVRIDVAGIENPVFHSGDKMSGLNAMRMGFPLYHEGQVLGKVDFLKRMGREPLLCIDDLVLSLSIGIGDFLARQGMTAQGELFSREQADASS